MHAGVKLLVGAVLVVVLPWALLVLLAMGPVGWLSIATVLAVVGVAWIVHDPGDASPPDLVNCQACGAPNDPDAAACDYCGAALAGAA